MKRTAFALAAALAAVALPAAAQKPTQQLEQTHESPAETLQGDRDGSFATNTWLDGMAEVELSKLAQQNASDDRVKQFAGRMIADHTKANDQLGKIAAARQLSLPTQLDGIHAALKRTLTGMKGHAFDREYMNAMVDNHKLAVNSFQEEAKGGSDPQLKTFAEQLLPALKDHLKMAEELQHAVTGTAR